MKSALANIGETEKSLLAAALEKAGLEGDREFIAANTGSFIAMLESLIDELSRGQSAEETNMSSNAVEDTAYLNEHLRIIKAACDDYDDTTVYTALDKLKKKSWKPETAAALAKIYDALFMHSDFEEAAAMAEKLTGGKA